MPCKQGYQNYSSNEVLFLACYSHKKIIGKVILYASGVKGSNHYLHAFHLENKKLTFMLSGTKSALWCLFLMRILGRFKKVGNLRTFLASFLLVHDPPLALCFCMHVQWSEMKALVTTSYLRNNPALLYLL